MAVFSSVRTNGCAHARRQALTDWFVFEISETESELTCLLSDTILRVRGKENVLFHEAVSKNSSQDREGQRVCPA